MACHHPLTKLESETRLKKRCQMFVLKHKFDLDCKLIMLIQSVPVQQTILLFGLSICSRVETAWCRLSNQTSLMTVYDWSEYICSWQMTLWALVTW